jgi:hypothetical protein
MATFLVRVELHGAQPSGPEYVRLHDAMAAVGFRRTISGVTDGGVTSLWQLPTGCYFIEAASTAKEIRARVQSVTEGLGYAAWNGLPTTRTCEAIVVEGVSSWFGMRQA